MRAIPRLLSSTRLLAIAACAVASAVLADPLWAQNCPAANPWDQVPDSVALQACIDGNDYVYLVPGNPGYIINDRLYVSSRTRLITSVGGKARLVAAPGLTRPILESEPARNGFVISELIVDGNRQNRTTYGYCVEPEENRYAGFYGDNLLLKGSNFVVHHVDTINAMCGSGLEVVGDGFEVYSVYAANNGEEAAKRWADGITLGRCTSGYVHNNYLLDNTDVGLVVFRGSNCTVRYNTVENTNRFAFAGIQVGNPGISLPSASLSGSSVRDNQIVGGYDRLGFGLMIGPRPWFPNKVMTDVGEVTYNSVQGAMANLVIDGIEAGIVIYNSLSNPQGTRSISCSHTSNYTAKNFGGATIQGGYETFSFVDDCQGQNPPGRWKLDGNGGCYWEPNDTGPDQCSPNQPPGRWKLDGNGGCYWEPNDTGPDQCQPLDASHGPLATRIESTGTSSLLTPERREWSRWLKWDPLVSNVEGGSGVWRLRLPLERSSRTAPGATPW